MNKKIYLALFILLVCGASFLLGRFTSNIESSTTIKYVEKATITKKLDSTEIRPISETSGESIRYVTVYKGGPEKVSETKNMEPLHIDTAQSISATVVDWNKVRKYEDTLIDSDTIGRIKYKATVQYNKLQSMQVDYTPVQKEVTVIKAKKYTVSPFIVGDINTFMQTSIGAGIVVNQKGIYVKYVRDFNSNKDGIAIGSIIYF